MTCGAVSQGAGRHRRSYRTQRLPTPGGACIWRSNTRATNIRDVRRILLLPMLISGCAGLNPATTYTGTTRPASGACDAATSATLTVRGAEVLFAPNSGTILLHGQRDGAVVTADTTLTGADKKPYRLAFSGTVGQSNASGSYVTPRCRYSVGMTIRHD